MSKEGRLKEALHILDLMNKHGICVDSHAYVFLLQECIKKKSLEEGKLVHAHIINSRFKPNIFLRNALVSFYSKSGMIKPARQLFDNMLERNVVTWTAMMSGYARCGQGKAVLELYWQMQQECVKPDNVTFVITLKACASLAALEQGKQIHNFVIKFGLESDIIVGSTLIDMYAKCGSLENAWQVFNKMAERNVVSWNVMIAGYAQHGQHMVALTLFLQMQQECIMPNKITFPIVLKACASLPSLEHGKQIHTVISKMGFESDVFVGNALIDMYAKCGSIQNACQVFDRMPERDVVSWNTMITGYAQHNHGEDALKLFQQMQEECVKIDRVTFIGILKACTNLVTLEVIHDCIIKSGLESHSFVGNTLIDMYAKCGSIEQARRIFDKMCERDMITWTVMITGYAHHGYAEGAIKLFQQMQEECLKPDIVTFTSVLKACANLAALKLGKQIHAHIIKIGSESDVFVGSTLVDMYAKCGSVDCAREVFNKMHERNAVSWNAMIAGYAQHGHVDSALKLFWQMQWEYLKPDNATFINILKACANLASLEQGKKIHGLIVKSGFESDVFVGSTLVDMYAKCGSVMHARQVFDKMPGRDLVLWNTMIGAYAQHGHAEEALKLFQQMQQEFLKLDSITFIGILSACSNSGLVDEGQYHFDSMNRDHGIIPTGEHYTCMVDLLGRAGQLDEAVAFISKMPFQPTAFVWMALLGGCRVHGQLEIAKHAAENILELEPRNASTFVLLSNIYAAASRWDDASKVRNMMEDKGMKKSPGHSCIEANNRVHEFFVEDISHLLIKDIRADSIR